jgi:hypothetical protein
MVFHWNFTRHLTNIGSIADILIGVFVSHSWEYTLQDSADATFQSDVIDVLKYVTHIRS